MQKTVIVKLSEINGEIYAICIYHTSVCIVSLAIFHPHFVILIFPSTFYHPHFSILNLSLAFYHLHFSICNFPSAFYHPPSAAIRSALYRDPIFWVNSKLGEGAYALLWHAFLFKTRCLFHSSYLGSLIQFTLYIYI